MIAEIHVLPAPAGTGTDPWAHVDAAIAAIAASGLRYEVGALGTTVEGDADAVWALVRRAHEAPLAAGAERTVTVVKLLQGDGVPDADLLVAPHRPPRRG